MAKDFVELPKYSKSKLSQDLARIEGMMKLMKKYGIEELTDHDVRIVRPVKPFKEPKPRIRKPKAQFITAALDEAKAELAQPFDPSVFLDKYEAKQEPDLDAIIDADPNFEAFNRGTPLF